MFTGLTLATLLGVPFGSWLGLAFGWRSTFWAVAAIGLVAFAVLAALVPREKEAAEPAPLREEFAVLARRRCRWAC
jgi:DHA1 family inner membrane transport protein